MEENKKQILQGQRPQKLNLNAPLLSTRRPPFSLQESNTTISDDTSKMVPFSWERIAGEPKDNETRDSFSNIEPMPPPPKLPPGRWQPPVVEEVNSATDHAFDRRYDVDEEEYGHSDIFSLAESIVNDVEVNCTTTKDRSSAILMELNDGYCHSSNFIIQRFLPDAQALAEASVVKKKVPFSTSPNSNASLSRAVSIKRSYHSPKGCGLGGFLPWKMKPKPCSVKSPVCDTIVGANRKQNR